MYSGTRWYLVRICALDSLLRLIFTRGPLYKYSLESIGREQVSRSRAKTRHAAGVSLSTQPGDSREKPARHLVESQQMGMVCVHALIVAILPDICSSNLC
jgi:hypothetical protein